MLNEKRRNILCELEKSQILQLFAMEGNPLGIILVNSDIEGDRLFFRYPYRLDTVNDTSKQSERRNP